MFNQLRGWLSSGNTNTAAELDSSTDQHVKIRSGLTAELENLTHEKFPQGFSKPILELEIVDANVNGQLQQRLQEESQKHMWKRIVLIPYYLENSHWTAILIEFKGAKEIQRAEYIDPVRNSQFISGTIQQEFNKLYPRVNLSLKELRAHNDPTQSEELTIQNLLKRVEELQITDAQYQKPESDLPDNAAKTNRSDPG
ncbi:unnamed protein product, partial [Rotaria sp. Silwood2]